jgi:hypothetical protein
VKAPRESAQGRDFYEHVSMRVTCRWNNGHGSLPLGTITVGDCRPFRIPPAWYDPVRSRDGCGGKRAICGADLALETVYPAVELLRSSTVERSYEQEFHR